MTLTRAITIVKNKLIDKVKKKGIYEDFGQKELNKLKDKYIDIGNYTDEMNNNRELIKEFNDWCMSYNG